MKKFFIAALLATTPLLSASRESAASPDSAAQKNGVGLRLESVVARFESGSRNTRPFGLDDSEWSFRADLLDAAALEKPPHKNAAKDNSKKSGGFLGLKKIQNRRRAYVALGAVSLVIGDRFGEGFAFAPNDPWLPQRNAEGIIDNHGGVVIFDKFEHVIWGAWMALGLRAEDALWIGLLWEIKDGLYRDGYGPGNVFKGDGGSWKDLIATGIGIAVGKTLKVLLTSDKKEVKKNEVPDEYRLELIGGK